MRRSIWNGTIAFGLVTVPIKVHSATESQTVHFHEAHAKDGSRIEHRRICPKDGKEVDYDDLVKGYEKRLKQIIHRKSKGQTIEVPDVEKEPSPVPDLMAALEATLDEIKSGERPTPA